jgi:outer membrane protein TolC
MRWRAFLDRITSFRHHLASGAKMKSNLRAFFILLCLLAFSSALLAQDKSKPLPFRTAIELALKNSAATGLARADLSRARATVSQSRDPFLPQMTVGSALGYSQGFPLSLEGSAPSLFNVNIQEFIFNSAQREYVKAAKSDAGATEAQNTSRRNDVIAETALDYMQLDLLDSSLSVQNEQQATAAKFQNIVNQRVQEGLDSQVDLTRARLAVARTRLDIAQTLAAADELRLRLSQLTGLPVDAIHTSPETIPEMPAVSQDDDLSSPREGNALVKFAEETARAKEFRARAERKLLLPTIDLAGQYAVLARFNNYDKFFQPNSFQRNNLSIGVIIRFPFLNPPLRAAANVAKFDAMKAHEEARKIKEQVGTETLKMQRTVQQASAARDVAQLEHELSQADVEAVQAKIEEGSATLKDEQNARVTQHQRYTAYLSSSFDLDKAQVQLLHQTGDLEGWALGPGRR